MCLCDHKPMCCQPNKQKILKHLCQTLQSYTQAVCIAVIYTPSDVWPPLYTAYMRLLTLPLKTIQVYAGSNGSAGSDPLSGSRWECGDSLRFLTTLPEARGPANVPGAL